MGNDRSLPVVWSPPDVVPEQPLLRLPVEPEPSLSFGRGTPKLRVVHEDDTCTAGVYHSSIDTAYCPTSGTLVPTAPPPAHPRSVARSFVHLIDWIDSEMLASALHKGKSEPEADASRAAVVRLLILRRYWVVPDEVYAGADWEITLLWYLNARSTRIEIGTEPAGQLGYYIQIPQDNVDEEGELQLPDWPDAPALPPWVDLIASNRVDG